MVSQARWLRDGWGGFVVIAGLLALAAVAPDPVPLGAARLAALATAVAGASLLVTRIGAADLATAAAIAAGAYLGGVGTALLGWPVLLGVLTGAAAGAVVGAISGALHGRVGRALGALTSLALGGGVVAGLGAWADGGGVAGFHAVRLIARGGARVELAVVAGVLLLALVIARQVAASHSAAAASLAVDAPVLAASLGRRPAVDAARIGAAAGALLGTGGTLLAAVDGSVVPAAYGLQLAAALALAALLGGAAPWGAVIGTLLVWGPSTIWPLVPLVGTAPPLLIAGPVGLLLLAVRRGRPLIPPPAPLAPPSPAVPPAADSPHAAVSPHSGDSPPSADSAHAADSPPSADGEVAGTAAVAAAGPRAPAHRRTLQVRGAETPVGPIDLDVLPGEVVALAGPNGAGKSTLLARIAGQLPDGSSVALDGTLAPRGPVARARAGIRRTWQRPPEVDIADLIPLTGADPAAAAAAAWAAAMLGDEGAHPGTRQLLLVAAAGPSVALFDEPTDVAAAGLGRLLRGLAQAGTAVLIVDHRPEVLDAADRVVTLGAEVVRP